MHSDFLMPASAATHAKNFKNTVTSTFFGRVEMWFKYQNNEQNMQIWDMQTFQIARF